MLDEYSIEQRATQIFDARTKEYFSEVLSCYAAGNHRSAVVMLWSVAVCDLLFKLQNLVDLYGDEKAKAILAKIGKLQEDNERSSIWEKYTFSGIKGTGTAAALAVPTENFNLNAAMATRKIQFTATKSTYVHRVSRSSKQIVVFRAVPTTAP